MKISLMIEFKDFKELLDFLDVHKDKEWEIKKIIEQAEKYPDILEVLEQYSPDPDVREKAKALRLCIEKKKEKEKKKSPVTKKHKPEIVGDIILSKRWVDYEHICYAIDGEWLYIKHKQSLNIRRVEYDKIKQLYELLPNKATVKDIRRVGREIGIQLSSNSTLWHYLIYFFAHYFNRPLKYENHGTLVLYKGETEKEEEGYLWETKRKEIQLERELLKDFG